MPERDFLVDIQLNQNELKSAVVENLASEPSSPKAGQVFFNTASSGFYGFTGVVWALLGASGGAGVTDHGALTGLGDDDHTQYLLASGARALTANWNATKSITASTFSSTETVLAPFTVASTSVVASLNADLLDGKHAAVFSLTGHTHTSSDITNFAEDVDDRVAALVIAGSGMVIDYNDGANTLTFYTTGGGGGAPVDAQYLVLVANGTLTQERIASFNATNFTTSDGGAGNNFTINTIQDIASSSGVIFRDLTLTGPATGILFTNITGIVSGGANTDRVPEGASNLYFTDERAQDAVGGILTDTSSIDLFYNDASNTISASAIPGGIDHGLLGGLGDDDHTHYLLASGARALTGDWNATKSITASTFNSTETTLAPFTVASTAVVTSLNADMLDGKHAAVFSLTGHTHTASEVTDFSEAVDDRVASLLVPGSGIVMDYNDGANTLTVYTTGGGAPTGASYLTISAEASLTAERRLVLNSTNFTAVDGGGNSDLTVNTIQDIASGSSPKFNSPTVTGLTINGLSGVLKATAGVIGGSADHSLLGSLTADDHLQYALLAPQTSGRNVFHSDGLPNVSLATFQATTAQASALVKWIAHTGEFWGSIGPSGDLTAPVVSIIPASGAVLTAPELRFYETPASGSFFLAFKGAANLSGSVTWNLPTIEGQSGQSLSTDGAGNLYWSSLPVGAAPIDPQYLVLAAHSGLTNERVAAFNTTNFSTSDGGAGNNYTINTIQDIASSSAVKFRDLTLSGPATGVLYISNTGGGIVSGGATTSNLPEGSNQYFTDERAQDAVGNILTDTSSIDFFYNDASNTISASAIPGGIDHGQLGGLGDDDHTQYLLASGARALTSDWNATKSITASTFNSTETTLAPFTVASTSVVVSLNADMLDGKHAAVFSLTGHTHIASEITDFSEAVDDRVAALLVPGSGLVMDYNDGANTLTIYTTGGTGGAPVDAQYLVLAANGTLTAERIAAFNTTNFTTSDGGAGNNFTINTIQDIASSSGVTFRDLTLTGPATGILFTNITGVVSGGANTDRVPEGASNLYFTDERAQDAVGGILTDTSSIDLFYNDASNTISASAIPGGIDHGQLGGLGDDDHTQYLLASGGRALTGDWNATRSITASTFNSTEATLAPFTVASTSVVTSLNADLLDGKHAAVFSLTGHTHTASEITDFSEAVDDRVAALMVPGSGIVIDYNDGANTLTVYTTGSTGGAPTDATYVTLSTNGTLTQERVLTGTNNQVAVTDNGAGSTVVLSTPQDIDVGAKPRFQSMTVCGGVMTVTGNTFDETLLTVRPRNQQLTAGTYQTLDLRGTFAPSGSTSATMYGLFFQLLSTGGQTFTGARALLGMEGSVSHGGSNTMTGAAGALMYAGAHGTGTLTNAYGLYLYGTQRGGIGQVTNSYEIYINSTNIASINANNLTRYGVYIDTMPDPGANTGCISAAIRLAGTNGFRDGIMFGSDAGIFRSGTATMSISGHLALPAALSELRFHNGSNYTGFKNGGLGSDLIYGLPSTAPVSGNMFLKTNAAAAGGSSLLKWSFEEIEKSMSVLSPATGNEFTLFKPQHSYSLLRVCTVLIGTGPYVTWHLRTATDRNAAGTLLASGNATETTSGNIVQPITASIASSSWLWLEAITVTGTVTEFHATVCLRSGES